MVCKKHEDRSKENKKKRKWREKFIFPSIDLNKKKIINVSFSCLIEEKVGHIKERKREREREEWEKK